MADRVSQRRGQTNKFYITLLSALLAFLSIYLNSNTFEEKNIFLIITGGLGILICLVWFFNIQSYRQLNTGKFAAIHELEEKLSYPFYKREWDFLGEGKDRKKYLQLSKIEKFVPFILSIPYFILIVYVIYERC